MNAAQAKRVAIDALEFMARAYARGDSGIGAGYAWDSLAHIAGLPELPLPWAARPPRREHAEIFAAADVCQP